MKLLITLVSLIVLVYGLPFLHIPFVSELTEGWRVISDADPTSQVKRLVLPCFAGETKSFVVEVSVQTVGDKLHVSELKNFGNFLGPEKADCILRSLENVPAERTTPKVVTYFPIAATRVEIARLSEAAPLTFTAVPSAEESSDPLRRDETMPHADLLHKEGTPIENDARFKELEVCSAQLPEKLLSQTIIGILRMEYVPEGGKYDVRNLTAEVPASGEAYERCLSDVLTTHFNQSFTPTVTVNGNPGALAPYTREQWFVREPQGSTARHYLWDRVSRPTGVALLNYLKPLMALAVGAAAFRASRQRRRKRST